MSEEMVWPRSGLKQSEMIVLQSPIRRYCFPANIMQNISWILCRYHHLVNSKTDRDGVVQSRHFVLQQTCSSICYSFINVLQIFFGSKFLSTAAREKAMHVQRNACGLF